MVLKNSACNSVGVFFYLCAFRYVCVCVLTQQVQSVDSQAKLLGKITSLEKERETKQEIPDPTPVEDCPLCLPEWRRE